MAIESHEIDVDELAEARSFFKGVKTPELEKVVVKFQGEQPLLAAFGYALRRNGIDSDAIGVLVQSVCEVYYVVRILRRKAVSQIGILDIDHCVEALSDLSARYNQLGSPLESVAKLGNFPYFDSDAIFEHTVDSLFQAFGDSDSILAHTEDLVFYPALLRAIEIAKWSEED